MRILILFCALFFVGCASDREVRVDSIDNIYPVQMSNTGVDMEFNVTLTNTFKSKVVIKKGWAEVINGEKLIARIDLNEKVVIAPSSTQQYLIPARIRIGQKSLSDIADMLLGNSKWKIRGEITGSKGIFGKKIPFEEGITKEHADKIAKYLLDRSVN